MKHSLEERITQLEKKVKYLETKLDEQAHSKHDEMSTTRTQTTTKSPTVVKQSDILTHNHNTISTKQTNKSEPVEWDVIIFQKIFPRVFIFILIIGVLWGLKASYDYGLITIHIILMLSFISSFILASLGILQIKKERRVLGQVLLGGSIAIFMLTTFTTHQLYHFIGPSTAMILNIVAIVAGIIFTYMFRSESIGVLSIVAGVFVPYLIESTVPNYVVFVTYETILYFVFLILALYLEARILYIAATFFLHVAIIGLHTLSYVPESLVLLTIMPIIFQQIALFGGVWLTNIQIKTQAHTLFVSLLLTSLWASLLLTKQEATVIFIGFAIMYAVSFYFFYQDKQRAPIFLVNASFTFLCIFLVHEIQLTYEIWLLSTLVYVFYRQKYQSNLHSILAIVQYIIAFILFSTYYIEAWFSYEMLHKLSFLAVTIGILCFIAKETAFKTLYQLGLLFLALLLLVFSTNITELIVAQWTLYESTPLILSSFWVLIAVSYMLFSKITSDTIGKFIGIAILFFTIAKVILFDISFMSMALRAILFIGLGIIGLIISRIYNKDSSESD